MSTILAADVSIEIAFNSSPYSYTPLDGVPGYGIEETCRRISAAGWDAVELAAVRPHAHPADNSDERFERVANALDAANLTPVHVCSHQVVLGLNPGSPDRREREAAIDHIRGMAEFCAALDIPSFHFHPGWSHGDQSRDSAWETAIETIDRALEDPVFEEVSALIEPLHWPISDLVHTPEDGLAFAGDLSNDVGLLIDTLQCHLDDIPLYDAIHLAGDALAVIHLADTDRLPPRDGELDFELVRDALEEIGFDGLASVEIWGDDPDKLARRSHETTTELFNR